MARWKRLCEHYTEIMIVGAQVAATMQRMDIYPNVQLHACWALRTLSTIAQNQKRAGEIGCIELVVQAMRNSVNNRQVQEQACWALCYLTFDDGNKARAGRAGVIPQMVHAMRTHPTDPDLAQAACRALRNITEDVDNQMLARQHKVTEQVLATKRTFRDKQNVKWHASTVLRNMRYEDSDSDGQGDESVGLPRPPDETIYDDVEYQA